VSLVARGRRIVRRRNPGERLYNGSLFYQLAEEVATRRATEWATLRGAVRSGIRGDLLTRCRGEVARPCKPARVGREAPGR